VSMSFATKRLGRVVERVTVGHVGPTSKFYVEHGVPLLRTQNVGDHEILRGELKHVSEEFHRRLGKSALKAGDILVSRVISDRVRCAVVPKDLEGANCANVVVIRPGAGMDANFIAYYLASPSGQRALLGRQVGSAQTVINTGVLSDWEIPCPPLSAQRRIAAIFQRAEGVRRKRNVAVALTDELLRSVFLEMFGDPRTNPKGWPEAHLGNLATTTSGGTPSRARADFFGGRIPWVKSGELHQDLVLQTEETLSDLGLENSSAKVMPVGTVLVAMYGATVGAVSVLGIDAATNQAVCCLSPGNNLRTEYLVVLLRLMTSVLLAQRVGGAQPNLSQDLIRNLVIPSPPLGEQQSFGRLKASIDRVRRRLLLASNMTTNLNGALVERAFHAELTAAPADRSQLASRAAQTGDART
jgi:type I restriction enzyme S subunit